MASHIVGDIVGHSDNLTHHGKLQDLIDNGVLRYINGNTLTTDDGTKFKYSRANMKISRQLNSFLNMAKNMTGAEMRALSTRMKTYVDGTLDYTSRQVDQEEYAASEYGRNIISRDALLSKMKDDWIINTTNISMLPHDGYQYVKMLLYATMPIH